MKHAKKQRSMTNILKTRGIATETACENNQTLDLIGIYFKVLIINMFTDLKDRMTKEVKEGLSIILHQKEDINRYGRYETEPAGNSGIENSGVERSNNPNKNSPWGLNSRFEVAEK